MMKKVVSLSMLLLSTTICLANSPFSDDPLNVNISVDATSLESGTSNNTVEESKVDPTAQQIENWYLTGELPTTSVVATSTVSTTTTVTATSTSTSTDTNTVTQTTEYTVKTGDYLSKIAKNLLGDAKRWPELVELNKDRYPSLLKNPNLIYPGWVLRIPGSSSVTTSPSTSTSTSVNTSTSTSTSTTTSTSTSVNTSTSTSTSTTTDNNISYGKAPKYTTGSAIGAPELIHQSSGYGGIINTTNGEFKKWFHDAIDTYGDWEMPAIKNKYNQTISVEMFMKAIMYIETGGVHRDAGGCIIKSSCGALGFMQLMPDTASGLGVSASAPKENIAGGCKLLKQIFANDNIGKKDGLDKLVLAACSYNAGANSSLVKGSWQDLKNSGSSVQSYGIKLKMCLGLELSADEKSYAQRKMTNGQSVESFANECYARAQGLGL